MPSRRWLNEIALVAALFYLLIDAYDRNLTTRTVILGLILLGSIMLSVLTASTVPGRRVRSSCRKAAAR